MFHAALFSRLGGFLVLVGLRFSCRVNRDHIAITRAVSKRKKVVGKFQELCLIRIRNRKRKIASSRFLHLPKLVSVAIHTAQTKALY